MIMGETLQTTTHTLTQKRKNECRNYEKNQVQKENHFLSGIKTGGQSSSKLKN